MTINISDGLRCLPTAGTVETITTSRFRELALVYAPGRRVSIWLPSLPDGNNWSSAKWQNSIVVGDKLGIVELTSIPSSLNTTLNQHSLCGDRPMQQRTIFYFRPLTSVFRPSKNNWRLYGVEKCSGHYSRRNSQHPLSAHLHGSMQCR